MINLLDYFEREIFELFDFAETMYKSYNFQIS